MLGVFAYTGGPALGIVTKSQKAVERFVSTAVSEFGVAPNKILIEQADDEIKVHFYNSRLKTLMEQALERKGTIFKYRNAYAANYIAGIFDTKGGRDAKSLYIRGLKDSDEMLFEQLGFHTEVRGSKTYIANENAFASFIKEFSTKIYGAMTKRHADS